MITEDNKWVLWSFPILKTYTLSDDYKKIGFTPDNYPIATYTTYDNNKYEDIIWTNRLICYKAIRTFKLPGEDVLDEIDLDEESNETNSIYRSSNTIIDENIIEDIVNEKIKSIMSYLNFISRNYIKIDLIKLYKYTKDCICDMISREVANIIRNEIAIYNMEYSISIKKFISSCIDNDNKKIIDTIINNIKNKCDELYDIEISYNDIANI